MNSQASHDQIENHNEIEIRRNRLYAHVYRNMVTQMAKNSTDEYF